MFDKTMFDKIIQSVKDEALGELHTSIRRGSRIVKRSVVSLALKTLFLILSITFLSLGVIFFGAKFIGHELMFLLVGFVLFIAFLLMD